MKGMQKIKRGNNFKGVLEYAFDRTKNEEKLPGQIVGGNMAGTNIRELTREFLRFADNRPDIKKPVWHNSLRLPEGDTLTDDQWDKLGLDYMERMGFDPNLYQYVFIKHDDKEGQHIHIIGSRIDMLGNVRLGKNENIISTRIISELEKDHDLTQTKNLDYIKDDQGNYHIAERSPGRGRTLSRAEEDMQNRKQWNDADYIAPKQRLADTIQFTLSNQPTTEEFIKGLEAENIKVMCVIKQGQMVGFSFEIDGQNFKGSQVGANWKELTNERKLNYEQERDTPIITSRRYVASKPAASNNATDPNASKKPSSKSTKEPRKPRDTSHLGTIGRDSSGHFISSRESNSSSAVDDQRARRELEISPVEIDQPSINTTQEQDAPALDDASRWGILDTPSIPEPNLELHPTSRSDGVHDEVRRPAPNPVSSNSRPEASQSTESQMIHSLYDEDKDYDGFDAEFTTLMLDLDHLLKTNPNSIKSRKLNEVAGVDISTVEDPQLKELFIAVKEYLNGDQSKYLTLQMGDFVKEFKEKQNKTPEEKALYKAIAELEDVK